LIAYASAGAAVAGGVLVVFTVVHFLEGNVISPYIVGSKVNLNPLATILAVLVGGELWGPAGMALFIPLVGILKLVLEGSTAAEPYARLLGTISAADLRPRTRAPFLGRILGRVRAPVR
jgi:predicted PurR-regulated permease PerM